MRGGGSIIGGTDATAVGDDSLGPVRDAIERQDWPRAYELATSAPARGASAAAERSDLLADACWWLGRLADCIAAREDAYIRYEELGDHRRAGQCAVWLWEHHAIAGRPVVAGGWLRRARRALAGDEECVEHVSLLLREAEVAHGNDALDEARRLAERALDMARTLRSADLEAEALQAIGRVLIDEGDLTEGMGHLDEAMLLALHGRLRPFSAGKVYCSMIAACEEADDFDRAAEWTDATLRWSDRHPFAIFPGICRVHRAIVLKRRGSLAEAESEAARASEELVHSHRRAGIAAFVEIGDIRRRLGDLERAEEAFRAAQELGGGKCGPLALLRLAQGRVDDARDILLTCLRGTTKRLDRAGLLAAQVQVAVATGELELADAALAELVEIARAYGTPSLQAMSMAARGRLELARGKGADACTTLQAAASMWSEIDAPYEVATALTLLGQALRDTGDTTAAADSFAEAAALFDQTGARLDVPDAERAVPTTPPAGLTDREVEVLRLVADGSSNADIARDLHLSPKTVSRHLSNIFVKIGVNSRAAATAFAYQHQLVKH